MKIKNYEEAQKTIEDIKLGDHRRGHVFEKYCVYDGKQRGINVIFTPNGWFYVSVDGYCCLVTGDKLSLFENPCKNCISYKECKDRDFENYYPYIE